MHLTSHGAAFLGATAACFGTTAAVFHVLVLFAFFGAGIADVGTERADFVREHFTACHKCGGGAANIRTLHVQLDAARQHFHVLFVKTSSGAMIAFGSAGVTSVDAGLMFFVAHNVWQFYERLCKNIVPSRLRMAFWRHSKVELRHQGVS